MTSQEQELLTRVARAMGDGSFLGRYWDDEAKEFRTRASEAYGPGEKP